MIEKEAAFECKHRGVSKAIRNYSRVRFESLARKAVFALQRISATNLYGDDFQHKTLWDEYCHEIHVGPHEQLESAWRITLEPIMDDIVRAVPREEAVLLSYAAAWELDEEDERLDMDSVYPDLLRRNLERVLANAAGARDMSRFDPTISP